MWKGRLWSSCLGVGKTGKMCGRNQGKFKKGLVKCEKLPQRWNKMKTRKLALPKEKKKKDAGWRGAEGSCVKDIFFKFLLFTYHLYIFSFLITILVFTLFLVYFCRWYCIVKNNQNLMKRCILDCHPWPLVVLSPHSL